MGQPGVLPHRVSPFFTHTRPDVFCPSHGYLLFECLLAAHSPAHWGSWVGGGAAESAAHGPPHQGTLNESENRKDMMITSLPLCVTASPPLCLSPLSLFLSLPISLCQPFLSLSGPGFCYSIFAPCFGGDPFGHQAILAHELGAAKLYRPLQSWGPSPS